MKSKFTKVLSPEKKVEDQDNTENEESSDVEAGGPAIASAKKNKIIVIALSSVLITLVIYFIFFKEGTPPKTPEKLQEVVVPPTKNVASDEQVKSPFETDAPVEKAKEEVDLLEKPAVPQIPALPENVAAPQSDLSIPAAPVANPAAPLTPPASPTQAPTAPANQQQVNQASNNAAPQDKVEAKKKDVDPRYAPIVVLSGGNGPELGVGYENNIVNLKEDPIAKLEKSQVGVKTTYVGDRSHSITQGKLITAVLETAINTEIPGSVRGIVSRDVYGEAGNEVLIPKGSRLYGTYSSQVARGQGRVNISWSRLIRPDGVDLAISFNASDQFGRAGIPGNIDNKYGTAIAGSLLTSVLAVGSAAIANKLLDSGGTVSTTTSNGATTTTGSATNQAIADVTKTVIDVAGQIVNNTINTTPVITVPQGTRITVIVNSDMNLPSIAATR